MRKTHAVGLVTAMIFGLFFPGVVMAGDTSAPLPKGAKVVIKDLGNDKLQVRLYNISPAYAELYHHIKTRGNGKVFLKARDKWPAFSNGVDENEKTYLSYDMEIGDGTNFKFFTPKKTKMWNQFSGYTKESWEGEGACTLHTFYGEDANYEGAEIVYCNDPNFAPQVRFKNKQANNEHPGAIIAR